MQMLEFFKKCALGFLTSVIAASLILMPYPNLKGSALATDTATPPAEQDCQADALNDDGSAGVYKPGCEFNEALAKLNEAPNEYSMEGIIEQFVMYSFAVVALQSLFFNTTERSRADCPMNNNAQFTLRMMQISSVLYVLGEMKAKAKMKEAQQLLVDAAFAPQTKQDESSGEFRPETLVEEAKRANQRQLDAYIALINVYKKKIEGIETKMKLASAAELGYLGALATELLLVQAEKRMCDTTYMTAKTASSTNTGTIAGFLAGASATAATVYGASLCAAGVGGMTALQTTYTTSDTTRTTNGQTKSAAAIAEDVEEGVSLGTFFAKIGSCIKGACIEGFDFGDLDAKLVTETSTAAADDITAATAQTTETTAFSTATSTCASCPSCVGVSGTMASDQATKQTPIQCCGADTIKGANGYSSIPYPSVMDKKIDISIKKIPLIGMSDMELMKPGILNFIEQYYFAKNFKSIKNSKLTAEQQVVKMANFYKQLDYLEQNFETEIWQHIDLQKAENELANSKEFRSNDLNAVIAKIKSELSVIKSAKAETNWSEILGFGSKLMLMSKLFGKFLRNKALPKPKSRMFTFGAIAAVNAAMIIWQNSKIQSNKDEMRIIQHEAQRFANSHAIKTEYDFEGDPENTPDGNGNSSNPDPYINTTGELACATPQAGGGFAPAACPATFDNSSLSLPNNFSVSGGSVAPELAQLPALLKDATVAAASGMEATKPKTYHGSLRALDKNRNAIKGIVDKLVDDFDKTNGINDKSDAKKKYTSLKHALATMQKTFKGTPINGENILNSSSLNNDLALNNDAKKAEDKEGASNIVIPEVAVVKPTSAGNFDFDLDSSDNGGTQLTEEEADAKRAEKIANYDLEQSDINQNTQVSIFRMISNRYLMSYDTLLKRKLK